MAQALTVPEFVARWQRSTLSERSAAQSHFIDLCEILDQPRPAGVDQEGNSYTFEKGVSKVSGGNGFADVWMRGSFAWEYKGKHKDLNAAYQQLLQYREDLDNPPLLVVCDLDRFEVHTNYTNTQKQIFAFALADLIENQPTTTCSLPPLEVLRALFTDPGRLKPGQTTDQVTKAAAAQFTVLAESLRSRGVPSERAAHFLMRLLFCLFSEDIGLLPDKLFSRLVKSNLERPADFTRRLKQLFVAMAGEGGSFGEHDIPYFDGGLFSDDEAYDLTRDDLAVLALASVLDWSSIEPAIFGTLFERGLDPDKRSQLGAHYTGEADIRLIVEPVLMVPLRRRWAEVEVQATEIIERSKTQQKAGQTKSRKALTDLLMSFAAELSKVRVLDPACGSGNFLYVALKQILDLEKKVSVFAASNGLSGLLPRTSPEQLYGIETNVYAHELASVVVWIGYIQWQHDNGFNFGSHPILKPLKNIKRIDAVLAYDEGRPVEPTWPEADFIVGNPPYVGGNRIRQELGDSYVDDLMKLYSGRLSGFSDLVCYWFEKARAMLEQGKVKRVGLLATQGIRGGVNRRVLEKIKETGDIFMAWSDHDWLLDGATVHISLVGFDDGSELHRMLDDKPVTNINADLTGDVDATAALPLDENQKLWAYGSQQKGQFDITPTVAQTLLSAPSPFGKELKDVVKRSINGKQLLQQNKVSWVIDFGENMDAAEAALYEAPFEYVRQVVYPKREHHREKVQREKWWLHARPSPKYRKIMATQGRYLATPVVSKHRIFVWLEKGVLVDHQIVVFTFQDDYYLGVLQSSAHEVWTRRLATQVRDSESGCRYTPQSTFETFPFPWPPGSEPKESPLLEDIAEAARELVEKRDAWLSPNGAGENELTERTLTNLYNARPAWLADAHRKLDEAVFAAYGWPPFLTDAEILEQLVKLNRERASSSGSKAT